MLREFTDLWPNLEGRLKSRLQITEQGDYDSYEKLLQIMLEEINALIKDEHCYDFSTKDITVIDYGDYQGTLILVFHKDIYQPSEADTYYTVVEYGSCSGCDTLLGISCYDRILPTEKQVEEYVTLCLHLLQHIKSFGEEM